MKNNFNYYVRYGELGLCVPIAGFIALGDAEAFVRDYTYTLPLVIVDADGVVVNE